MERFLALFLVVVWFSHIPAGDGKATSGTGIGSVVNVFKYKAKRYGSYYSTVYNSYSGGKGYARYSRVYKTKHNLYPQRYNYMFDWFKTKSYKVYKSSAFQSISLCKNYEADENGTYLGLFTCPLPFVPPDHAYCCGVTDAQYCCRFWDVPYNYAAAVVLFLLGGGFLVAVLYMLGVCCVEKFIKVPEVTPQTDSPPRDSSEQLGSHFQYTSEPEDYSSCYYDNSIHDDTSAVTADDKTLENHKGSDNKNPVQSTGKNTSKLPAEKYLFTQSMNENSPEYKEKCNGFQSSADSKSFSRHRNKRNIWMLDARSGELLQR